MREEDAIKTWNKMIRCLIAMGKHWLVLQEAFGLDRGRIEMFQPVTQKRLTHVSMRTKFIIMLPRLLDVSRRIGGIESLVINKEVIEKALKVEHIAEEKRLLLEAFDVWEFGLVEENVE